MRLKLTQAARRHRAGSARILAVVIASDPTRVSPAEPGLEERLPWVGFDDQGVELEILAVDQGDRLLIIHAMPTYYRRQQ